MKKLNSLLLCLLIVLAGLFSNVKLAFAENTGWGHPDSMDPNCNLNRYKATTIGALPCLGNPKVAVFYVTLKGGQENWDYTKEQVEDIFFSPDFKNFDPVGNYYTNEGDSLRSFYYRSSNGKVDIDGDVYEYTTLKDTSEYSSIQEVADEVFTQVTDIDWSQYDDNDDGYVDGVYFVARTKPSWSSPNFVCAYSRNLGEKEIAKFSFIDSQDLCTLEHETCHMFGPADVYAGVGVNPAGIAADSIMDGNPGDIPLPIKYVLGWLEDSVQYISYDESEIALNPSSLDNSALIVYPNKNTNSKFVFFIENVRHDSMNPYTEVLGGIRIWRCIMNLDEKGNIINTINGNPVSADTFVSGMPNSPFDYLEALHPEGTTNYLFQPGEEITPYTNPSTACATSVQRNGGIALLKDYAFSGVIITINGIDDDVASVNVGYSNTPRTTPTNCELIYYNKQEKGRWMADSNKALIGEIHCPIEVVMPEGNLTLRKVGGSSSIAVEPKVVGSTIYLYLDNDDLDNIDINASYRLEASYLQTYYGGSINFTGENVLGRNIARPFTQKSSTQISVNNSGSFSDTFYLKEQGDNISRIYYNPQTDRYELLKAPLETSEEFGLGVKEIIALQYPDGFAKSDTAILDAYKVDDNYYLVTKDGVSIYDDQGTLVSSHQAIGRRYVGKECLTYLDGSTIYELTYDEDWMTSKLDGLFPSKAREIISIEKLADGRFIILADNGLYHYNAKELKKIRDGSTSSHYSFDFLMDGNDALICYVENKDLVLTRVDPAGNVTDKANLIKSFTEENLIIDKLQLQSFGNNLLVSFTSVPASNIVSYTGHFVNEYSLNGDLKKHYRFGNETTAYEAKVIVLDSGKVLICGNSDIDYLADQSDEVIYQNVHVSGLPTFNITSYFDEGVDIEKVKYVSSDDSILNVSTNGDVSVLKSGKAIINVYYNNRLYMECAIAATIADPTRLTIVENNGLELDWVSDPDADGYYIERSKDGIDFEYLASKLDTNENIYYDLDLEIGDSYYYRVGSYFKDGSIYRKTDFTNVVQGTLTTEIRDIIIMGNADTLSVNLNWNRPDKATGYKIYRAVDGGEFTLLKSITKAATTTYSNTSLLCNKQYSYKITYSYVEDGITKYSGFSNEITIRPLPKEVTNLKATSINENSASISWSKVTGATGYVIYESNNGFLLKLDSIATTKYTLTDLAIDTSKKIVVKAYAGDENTQSKKGVTVSVKGVLTKPVVTAQMTSIYDITLDWDYKGENIIYTIYRSTNSKKSFKKIGESATTSYVDKTAKFGTKYYYKVKSNYASGSFKATSSYSKVVSGKLSLAKPSISSVVEISPEDLKINLTKPVDFAGGYQLYRAASKSGKYKSIGVFEDANDIVDGNVTPNKTYYYKVKAIRVVGKNTRASSTSSYKKGKATFDAPTINNVINVDYDHIHIDFSADQDSESYYVLRCTDPTFEYYDYWPALGNNYDDDYEVEIGKTYYYRVKSVYRKKNGDELLSASSKTYKIVYNIAAPTIKLTNAPTGIHVLVSNVADMSGYKVYRATSSKGKYSVVELDEFGIDTSAVKGKTYYYKVRAIMERDGKEYYSAYSAIKSLKCTKK